MEKPTKITSKNGNIVYRLNGKYHRVDGPAVITSYTESWYRYGEYHRDNGPAVTYKNGTRFWYQHNKLHREDGPACIFRDGRCEYWLEHKKILPGSLAMKLIKEKERRNANT